jgi:hypothetical protein
MLGTAAHRAAAQCDPQWLTGPGQGAPGIVGSIFAIVPWDPDGAGPKGAVLVAGGSFTIAGRIEPSNIAFFDGKWNSLGAGFSGYVGALAVHGGALYAGGGFNGSGPTSLSRIARWDGLEWRPLGSGADQPVTALASFGGHLYAGGAFANAGGSSATRIARWTGGAWEALGTGITGTGTVAIDCMAVWNGALYVGGSFASAGGVASANVAKWDGQWSNVGRSSARIRAMAVYRNELIIGGERDFDAELSRRTATGWETIPGLTPGSVRALATLGSYLYVGGQISAQGAGDAFGLLRWNTSSWQGFGTAPEHRTTLLAVHAGQLAVVGTIRPLGTYGGENITFLSSGWTPLGDGLGSKSLTEVRSIAEYEGDLVFGGHFVAAGVPGARLIARWDGTAWRPFGDGLAFVMDDTLGGVFAMAVYRGHLFAGGYFRGLPVGTSIAEWTGSSWVAPGGGLPVSNVAVWALEPFRDRLIAGGAFSTIGGMTAKSIAAWDGVSWSAMGAGVNGEVLTLCTYNNDLIAGGSFTTAGGNPALRVARWDGQAWHAMGAGLDGPVNALVVHNGELYAGGSFSFSGSTFMLGVARWTGTAWAKLNFSVWIGYVNAMLSHGGELIVAGSLTDAGVPVNRIARWDGSVVRPLGSGVNDEVRALRSFGSQLVVGGRFNRAGDRASNRWARWGCRSCRADLNGDGSVNAEDYSLFLSQFEDPASTKDALADYNEDGFVDGLDYDQFNNDFEAGC